MYRGGWGSTGLGNIPKEYQLFLALPLQAHPNNLLFFPDEDEDDKSKFDNWDKMPNHVGIIRTKSQVMLRWFGQNTKRN